MGLDQLIQAHFRELCGLLALLTLWLITRLYEEPKKRARVAPTRHSPVTAEELGRTVFSIAGSDDFDAYRVLFLSGSEASQILGSLAAKQYLVRRTLSALGAAFEVLLAQLPHGVRYVGTELLETGQCVMSVHDAQQRQHLVVIGSVAHVGAVMRLVEPGVGPVAQSARELPPLDEVDIWDQLG
jgi:hypothetical protein